MTKQIRSIGTLIECEGKILVLRRRADKMQGDTWALPAGRPEGSEKDIETAVREVYEETGYRVKPEQLEYVTTFDWHFPDVNVVFPTYRLRLLQQFEVRINPEEHSAYQWMSPQELHARKDLVHGFHDLLEKVYRCGA